MDDSLSVFVVRSQWVAFMASSGCGIRIMSTLLWCLVNTTPSYKYLETEATGSTSIASGDTGLVVSNNSKSNGRFASPVPSDIREEIIDALKTAFVCVGYDNAFHILISSFHQSTWLLRIFEVAKSTPNPQEAALTKATLIVSGLRSCAAQGDWKKFKTSLKALIR